MSNVESLLLKFLAHAHSGVVVGWNLSNTLEASRVVEHLHFSIQAHGKTEIINSGQSS